MSGHRPGAADRGEAGGPGPDNFAELSLPVKSKPVERMVLREDGGWLRVFVS